MRVVSLNCSNTEIACALGCGHLLVGVDDHSDFPPEVVAALPRVGPDLDPDMERVKALEPDLVLASLTVPGHEKVLENLDKAGVTYLAPEPTTLQDVYGDIGRLAGALGVEDRAAGVIAEMQQAMTDARTPAADYRPSILVQWWPKPVIAPGRLSWVHDLLELAGAANPLSGDEVKSRPLENGEVLDIDPDVIVMAWCGVEPRKYRADVIYDKPEWASLKAVRNRRVYAIPEAYLGRPSPRLTSGNRALRSIVRIVAGRPAGSDAQRHSEPSP